MRNLTSLLLLVLAPFVSCPVLADDNADAEKKAILKIEEEWSKAMVDGDGKWFKKMLSDDFKIVLPDGQIWDRTKIADAWTTGTFDYSKCDILDLAVRLFGNTAVVIGRADVAGKANGKPFKHIEQWTDIYVKADGDWRCVSSHVSSPEK